MPTFLIIGAMKAGTTSLYHLLGSHPDVFLPENKEPDFFVTQKAWSNGVDWYRSLFVGAGGARAVGEASTSYSKCTEFPGVPERIARLLPDVRLVYVLREPISRMRSMYLHNVRQGREVAPVDEALLSRPMYLDASRYALQLDAYLEHFARAQIHVLLSEDLRREPQATIAELARFLGLDTSHRFAARDYNVAAERRRETAWSRAARRLPLYRTALRLAPDALTRQLYRTATRPAPAAWAHPSTETIAVLTERLQPDLMRLQGHLGEGFDAWGLLHS